MTAQDAARVELGPEARRLVSRAFRVGGGRSLSLNLGSARLYLWRDGFRRFGLTVDASDLRDAW